MCPGSLKLLSLQFPVSRNAHCDSGTSRMSDQKIMEVVPPPPLTNWRKDQHCITALLRIIQKHELHSQVDLVWINDPTRKTHVVRACIYATWRKSREPIGHRTLSNATNSSSINEKLAPFSWWTSREVSVLRNPYASWLCRVVPVWIKWTAWSLKVDRAWRGNQATRLGCWWHHQG